MLALVALAVGTNVARADRALVVGINRYPHYADMDLSGPVNDARAMSVALQRHGFRVTTLTDGQATRGGVLNALKILRGQMQPRERLVFYFSGHGARDARDHISVLAHDALVDEHENPRERVVRAGSIPIAELHQAVCAIPARGRTIILDAPFPQFRSAKPVAQSTLGRATRVATASVRGGHKACYYLASRLRENPGEDVFAGVSYGVFTYFLVKHLNALAVDAAPSGAIPAAIGRGQWNDLFTRMSSDVVSYMDGRQHPRLSAPYLQSAIFEGLPTSGQMQIARAQPGVGKAVVGKTAGPIVGMPQPVESMRPEDVIIHGRGIKIERKPKVETPTKPTGTWGEWSDFNAKREQLALQMRPDKIDIAVGQEVAFEVSIATPGYLVVLERGTSGKVNLMFPVEAKIEQARVEATMPDRPLRLPNDDLAFAPDAPGLERIRAFWFADQSAAEALLGHFGDGRSLPDASVLRRPDAYSLASDGVRTADVLFEVVPPPTP